MALGQALAGGIIFADDIQDEIDELASWQPLSASKAADTSRNTLTVRAADPDLVIAMAANTTYDLYCLLIGASAANSAGDFSGEWQYPSDAVLSFTAHGLIDTITSGTSGDLQAGAISLDPTTPAGPFVVGLSTSNSGTIIMGRVTAVTAGNLTLAWAQASSNANNSTLRGGSYVTLHKVL